MVVTLTCAIVISVLTHRVSYGYHHVSDVLIGCLIGGAIGYFLYSLLTPYQWSYIDKDILVKNKIYQWLKIGIIFLSVLGILHCFVFRFKL